MLILASKGVNNRLLGAKKRDIGIERIKWQERIDDKRQHIVAIKDNFCSNALVAVKRTQDHRSGGCF